MLQLDPPEFNFKKNSIIEQHTCQYLKPAYRLCMSQTCIQPALCCQDQDCQCNKIHDQCPQIRCKNLFDKLNAKIIDSSPILKKVTDLFDNLIDQVSQILQESQKIIKKYGLRKPQIDFLQYFQENRTHTLRGKVVSKANKLASQPYGSDLKQIQNLIDTVWNHVGHLFLTPLFSIKDIIQAPISVNNYDPFVGQNLANQMIEQVKQSNIRQKSSNKIKQKPKIKNQINNPQYPGLYRNLIVERNQDLNRRQNKPKLINEEPIVQNQGLFGKNNNTSLFGNAKPLFGGIHKDQEKRPSNGLFSGMPKQQSLFGGPFKKQNLFQFKPRKQQKKEEQVLEVKKQQDAKKQDQNKDKKPVISSQKVDYDALGIGNKKIQKQGQKVFKDVSKQEFLQASIYLCQILGCDAQKCVKFIHEKGCKDGKLLDKQEILNLALEDARFLEA